MKCKLIILLMMVFLGVSLQAECDYEYRSHGLYIGGMTGLNLQLYKMNGQTVHTYPGFVGSGAVGYKFGSGVRVEAEYSYRRNGIQSMSHVDGGFNSGHADTQAYTGNILYDIDLYRGWTPYFGMGLGYARVTASINTGNGHVKLVDRGLAVQYIGGINHRIMYNTDLGLEMRFFRSRRYAQDYSLGLALRRFF